MSNINLLLAIESLRQQRQIFHSEADLQFALAWEIQRLYPDAMVRLEYPLTITPKIHIDIVVCIDMLTFPIELKYMTKKMSTTINGEQYNLKDHGAQDTGAYDLVKDICRVELSATDLQNFKCGYVLWLTNDSHYWNAPKNDNVGYFAFSVHEGTKKAGAMSWGSQSGSGTIKGREHELLLQGEYEIEWKNYSSFIGVKNGLFKYAITCVV